MESPEPTSKIATAVSDSSSAAAATAITTVTTSTSSPVQESPFSSFLSNLSPIPVKAPHVLQGFLGFNSPPLVFTSPRVNAIRETSSLKRPQGHQLVSAEISHNVDGGRKIADAPSDVEKSDSLLDSGLVADTHKNGHMKNLVQLQPSSSSGCVDEYLADPADVDCANSAYAMNPNLKQPDNLVQSSPSGIIDSKKTMPKIDDKNELKMKVDVPVARSGEAEQNFQGKSRIDVKQIRSKGEETCGALPSNQYSNIDSNLSVEHASSKQQFQDSGAQHTGSVHEDESCCPPQLLPQPLQIVQTYEDSEDNTEALPHRLDSTMHDLEASQHQRGLSRRCLQFEEAQPKSTVNRTNPSNQANNVTISRSPGTPAESLNSSYVEKNATSSQRQLVNLSQPLISPHHAGKSSLTVSRPSGIGLHLNSIVNALPKGHAATAGVKLASSGCGMLESKASVAVSSMIPESSDNMGPLNMLPPIDHHATPLTKRNFSSEHADSFGEFSQTSPKKKRKKSSSTVDGDGCKRCNCKKSKCLKLYCDCFAAGIYCAESCACQGCFNRPEYEDTVLETRQQIESRDPLAFAPKIVQHANKFPVKHEDDGNLLTPSSARHKRGCNCKRSMCLKKYCECYQANVGCSSGCRCEGCKNVYGRKEDYVAKEEILSIRSSKERSEETFDDKLEMVTNKKGFLHSELYDPYNITPGILSRRYVPSPESDLTILSSYTKTPRSQKNSDSNDMLLETSKEIPDMGSCGQNTDYNSSDMMDQFSSRRDALADLCNLTPLLDYPSMASSASSKATDRTNVSKLQLCPKSGGFSAVGSLRWRSSPVTPMTQLRGTKSLQAPDSESGLCDFLEDDTPEILKDASPTPIKAVKVSSPSRKRVSPPHSHLHELGSSSSGILKSGRKFILKAVPSFPPLTPCIDSKRSTDEKRSDIQENKEATND